MKFKSVLCLFGILAVAAAGRSATTDQSSSDRYGLFDGLDHRSVYGQGYFPEPFLVDDSDLEPGEARLDWTHIGAGSAHSDEIKAEVEQGFGLLTLELELPYERDVDAGAVSEGFGNIEVAGRYPFYQFVSAEGVIDSTFGAGLELALPTHSTLSKNTELVPKVFNDLKVYDFTLQSIVGYSMLFGPGEDGGARAVEYGFVLSHPIPHRHLPLPGVLEVLPVAELTGETALNHGGGTALLGDAGFRLFCKSIGRVQPRVGMAFVFPLNTTARQDTHWGVVTSLVFQY